MSFTKLLLAGALVAQTALTPLAAAAADADEREPSVGSPRTLPPLPDGFRALWAFPGARTSGTAVSTSAHCTNFNKVPVLTRVECIDFTSVVVGSGQVLIGPGQTATFTCGTATVAFAEDSVIALSNDLNQGWLRVLASIPRGIGCNAQVLDATSAAPAYAHSLTHFTEKGKH